MNLFKLFGRRGAGADARPPAQRPQMVPTGAKFPELCNLVEDFGDERFGAMVEIAARCPWIAQLKVDGIRALYIDGRIVSREGAPLDCALHALPGLQRLEAEFGEPMFFDMEYASEIGFDATEIEHKRGIGTGVCWIHDAFPLREWMAGGTCDPVERRLGRLLSVPTEVIDSDFVGMMQNFEVTSVEQAQQLAERIWSHGYEGIVLKRVGSPYQRRRTADWLKVKKLLVADMPIIDVLLKGDRCTGIMVKGPTGPLKITSGISQLQLAAFHRVHTSGRALDGATARIAYNEKAGTNTPRHARFVGVV